MQQGLGPLAHDNLPGTAHEEGELPDIGIFIGLGLIANPDDGHDLFPFENRDTQMP